MAGTICFKDSIFNRFNPFCSTVSKTRYNHTISFHFFAITLIFLFFIISTPSVQAGNFNIDVSPDGIEGFADNVPLAQVLAKLAQKTGYRVYFNEKLNNAKASFIINRKINPEKAIKLMIHPHSNVMIFGGRKDINNSDILEVKVFPKGTSMGSYVALHSNLQNQYSVKNTSFSRSGKTDTFESNADYGRRLDKNELNNKIFTVEKSAFGTPVIKKKRGTRGPDYSLNSSEMRKSYEKYKSEKKKSERRMASHLRKQGYQMSKKEKQEYISDRQKVYQNLLNKNKNSN